MAKASLVDEDIQAGRRLIEVLDRRGVEIVGALWYYTSEDGWRLLLATPSRDREGPIQAYQRIQEALGEQTALLMDISVRSPSDRLVQLLAGVVHTGPGIAGIRFTANAIDGMFIEDAYIYRLNLPAHA
jgi:hypothetical protein